MLIYTALGWNLATLCLMIKGDRMSRRADQKLYAEEAQGTEVAV
jgi:hypothetical protein